MPQKSSYQDKRAHVSLPPEMRPLLDQAQEKVGESSWTATVQLLLENFINSSDGERQQLSVESVEQIKAQAVEQSVERITTALAFAFNSLGLDFAEEEIATALAAVAHDSHPVEFAAFALKLFQGVEAIRERQEQLEDQYATLIDAFQKVESQLASFEQAMIQQRLPQIIIHNADADADASADADQDKS